MKLKVFDRILLAILLIVAILTSVVLFAMALNIVTLDMATAFISLFYLNKHNALILAGSGVILFLIALKLLFAGRGERKPELPASALIRQSDIGGTFISLQAIDSMVQKFCASQQRIRESSTSVRAAEGGVTIGVRLSVLPETDIVTLTQDLQKSLKEHVETLTGIQVREVGILVESATASPAGAPPARVN